jgi:hypothetical protein
LPVREALHDVPSAAAVSNSLMVANCRECPRASSGHSRNRSSSSAVSAEKGLVDHPLALVPRDVGLYFRGCEQAPDSGNESRQLPVRIRAGGRQHRRNSIVSRRRDNSNAAFGPSGLMSRAGSHCSTQILRNFTDTHFPPMNDTPLSAPEASPPLRPRPPWSLRRASPAIPGGRSAVRRIARIRSHHPQRPNRAENSLSAGATIPPRCAVPMLPSVGGWVSALRYSRASRPPLLRPPRRPLTVPGVPTGTPPACSGYRRSRCQDPY